MTTRTGKTETGHPIEVTEDRGNPCRYQVGDPRAQGHGIVATAWEHHAGGDYMAPQIWSVEVWQSTYVHGGEAQVILRTFAESAGEAFDLVRRLHADAVDAVSEWNKHRPDDDDGDDPNARFLTL